MNARLRRFLGLKPCSPTPTDLHQFMTQCSPNDRKAIYLEAARRAVAEQRQVLNNSKAAHAAKP